MNLMRVMTPEEINALTTTYYGERRVSLTSILDKDVLGVVAPSKVENVEPQPVQTKAKILPFGNEENASDNSKKPFMIQIGPRVMLMFKRLYGISENSFESLGDEAVEVTIENTGKGTSLFILDEKSKLEISQRKLKSKEVLGTYKKVASMDLETEKNHKDDLSWSSHSGFLVNKKQF